MQNPLILDPRTPRGKVFTAHTSSFQPGDLAQGIFDSHGYCTFCHVTSPAHFEKITCLLCARVYHATCLRDKIGRGTVAALVKNPSLWWFCLECLHVANSTDVCLSRDVSRGESRDESRSRKRDVRSKSEEKQEVEDVLAERLNDMKVQIYDSLKSEMEEKFREIISLDRTRDSDQSRDSSANIRCLSPIHLLPVSRDSSPPPRNGTSTPRHDVMSRDDVTSPDHQSRTMFPNFTSENRSRDHVTKKPPDLFSSSSGFSGSQTSSGSSDKIRCETDGHHNSPVPHQEHASSPFSPNIVRRLQNNHDLDRIRDLVEMGRKSGKEQDSKIKSKKLSVLNKHRMAWK